MMCFVHLSKTMDKNKLLEELRGIRRIAICKQHGGFGLSEAAQARYKELAGITDPNWYERDIARDDPYLIQVINELGETANTRFCTLKIVEVPADVEWLIEEYDGLEWVAEKHRTWE
jgi:hypothetical protein